VTSILLTEWRLQLRHGVIAAVGIVTTLWVAGLSFAPATWRPELGRWAIFFDLAGIGLFFVPSLIAVERGSGVNLAVAVSPVPPTVFLMVRVGTIAALAALAGTVVLVAARVSGLPIRVLGVVGLAVLMSLVSIVAMGPSPVLTEYMSRVPFLAVPLLAPALLEMSGAVDSPLLGLSPVTSAMRMLGAHAGALDVAWLGLCLAALVRPAQTAWGATAEDIESRSEPESTGSRLVDRIAWWRSHAGVDRRTLGGDRLLLLVLAGVPAIALGVRWLTGPGAAWFESRWGIDLTPYLPLIWAFVIVAHTPTMFGGVAGLLFLEDRDAGVLPAVAVTRSSVRGLVVWRLVAVWLLTTGGVVMAALVAGAMHPAGMLGIAASAVAAGAVATMVTMLLAAFGKDRVQGMAVMKVLGLPIYSSLAAWAAPSTAVIALLLIPSTWAIEAFWAPTAGSALAWATGGVAVSTAWVAALVWRFERSSMT